MYMHLQMSEDKFMYFLQDNKLIWNLVSWISVHDLEGYSDLAEEGVWKWVTCESPDAWQQSLWAPGYPQNGLDDCGVFDPDNMNVYDQVCDMGDIKFLSAKSLRKVR